MTLQSPLKLNFYHPHCPVHVLDEWSSLVSSLLNISDNMLLFFGIQDDSLRPFKLKISLNCNISRSSAMSSVDNALDFDLSPSLLLSDFYLVFPIPPALSLRFGMRFEFL